MAFENVYLTKEEKEEFKKRSIPSPDRNVYSQLKSTLGEGLFVNCTMDRERKIYLFYCGQGEYNFETPPDDYYFALVWDEVTGNNCVSFRLKYEMLPERISGTGSEIFWHLLSMNISKELTDKKEEIIEIFKEAMQTYGILGDPRIKTNHIVKFDF